MRSKRQEVINPLLVLLFSSVFALGFPVHAKDPAIGRAEAIQKMSVTDFEKQSLRFKMVSTRSLILYMQDILPKQGNPHFHMAEYAAQVSKEAFKKAQKNNSSYMDDTSKPQWLPIESETQTLTDADFKDDDTKAVLEYLALYVATTDVMKTLIQPILSQSIIVDSIEDSVDQKTKIKFDQAWEHINYLTHQYKNLLNKQQISRGLIPEARRRVVLSISGLIAQGMSPHLSAVSSNGNQKELLEYLKNVTEIATESAAETNKKATKDKVNQLHSKKSALYRAASSAFESVDLPDSGDIDGADQAFEVAMRLEVGFDLLKNLFTEISRW